MFDYWAGHVGKTILMHLKLTGSALVLKIGQSLPLFVHFRPFQQQSFNSFTEKLSPE